MTRYLIDDEKDNFRAILVLTDLVRKKAYPNTMIGPFEDYVILSEEGIMIDGEREARLSRAFSKALKRKRIKFEKVKVEGNHYYGRDW